MNASISSLRRLFNVVRLMAALLIGLALAALVQGAVEGPRWLLITGIPATALVLTVLGDVAEPMRTSTVMTGLRSGGPRAFAPAVVNGVRTVDRKAGRPVLDGRSVNSVFAFDLTVMPEDRPAYRIQVCHPLDVQGLTHRSRAVVEYDPEQPWRVVVPDDPPRAWLARAAGAPAPTVVKDRAAGLPAGFWTLVTGVVCAAVLLTLMRLLG
ncbi:hypothetical protein ACFVFH_13750 [Streptomyces sp. NPDC057697]|uniref:hypothetical protein n=1 Tax=Streptomyces sp. NPDC057697 TaxID=3346219 RepID=UPI0036A113C3